MERKEVDMHIHSHYSDGDCSPEELIKRIKEAGLKAAVLTDHDGISFQENFLNLCVKNNIDTLTGVEITTTHYFPEADFSADIHILGYGFDLGEISKFKEELLFNRTIRARQIAGMIGKYKINKVFETSFPQIKKRLQIPLPASSKYWLAKLRAFDLMNRSCDTFRVNDSEKREFDFQKALKRAFKEISKDGDFYHPREMHISPDDAIDIINSSKGVAVWAHPMKTLEELKEVFGCEAEYFFEELLVFLKEGGLYGLEVYTGRNYEKGIRLETLLDYCEAYELNPNFGGSDYHGDKPNEHLPNLYLGKGGISYKKFEELVDFVNKLRDC